MSKIFVVIGKSASGKDTIYRELAKDENLGLKEVVGYTTRPIREGEQNGITYHFVTTEDLNQFKEQKKVIEHRTYNTIHGPWHYFTVYDHQINLVTEDYIMIGTLESFVQIRNYFGEDAVIPIYIQVENGERLARALGRERRQEQPKYEEMCRRFLSDEQDFSEEKIVEAGITKRFDNIDFTACIEAVSRYIRDTKKVDVN